MMLIDTHCHLDADEFSSDRDAVVDAAKEAGIYQIVVPAVAVDNFSAVRTCVSRYSGCFAAYGLHPLYVDRSDEGDLSTLKNWLLLEKPVAVGEIGLDFYVPGQDKARQVDFFVAQLKLAADFNLPVILHGRKAIDQLIYHLRRVPVRGGILHAFNGSLQQAAQLQKLNFKLGFGGAITYAGSRHIRALAVALPDDAILLETDAPDMSPAWLRSGRNAPAELQAIAACLAELRGRTPDEIADICNANADAVLSLSLRGTL